VVQNPQWPVIDEAISFPSGPNTPPGLATDLWCSVIGRTEGATTSDRGRLYELDQVQTGESTVMLRNTDGAFDPDNASSPFWPQVIPYRAHRRRAQYPPTVNLLLPSQATSGLAPDTPGGSPLALGATLPPSVYTNAGGFATTVADTGSYNDYQLAFPASPGVHGREIFLGAWSATPGQAHTGQVRARFTAGVAIQMQLSIQWIGVDGHTQVGFTSGAAVTLTGADQTLTVTSTAPANTAGGVLILWNTTSPASTSTVRASQFQIELGSTPSAYAQPSIWFPLITDFVLEWPQTWLDNGNYGVSSLRCVDAFGYLSQRNLKSPAYMELLALGPSFFYPLDEATDTVVFADLTANRPNAGVLLSAAANPAQVTAGSSLQSTASRAASGFLPQGIGGPVVTFSNDPAGLSAATINMAASAQAPVGPPTGAAWTRLFAFRMPAAPSTNDFALWFASDQPGLNAIGITTGFASGVLAVTVAKNGSVVLSNFITATSMADGGWHLVGISMSSDGKSLTTWLDSGPTNTYTTASDMRPVLTGGADLLGGEVLLGSGTAYNGFIGDLALAAELPYAITNAQWTAIYSAFRYGGSGRGVASSGTRYQDILRWAQWVGPQSEDTWTTGETNAYGPAVDLLAAAADQGTDVVTAGQNVVTTENGNHFVAKDGTVTFKARRARYNLTVPAATFGENTAGGEIPYTTASFGYDVTRLGNDASINQTSTGVPTRVIDQPSITTYGDVQLQRDVNTLDGNELFDAATFLVDRYRNPAQRLQTISIDLAANPAAWPTLLALELGSLAQVMRRPPNAPALSFLGFVEKITWNMTDQVGAVCSLEISSATGLQYEVAGSTRMTLKNAVTAAATSMTCNPLADAATNPIQANISGSDGYATWVIDWGTANAEYVQINAVTPNSPGYTSAVFGIGLCTDVVTLATGTGFRHAHAIGATLQDIGGAANIYTLAQLTPLLTPANQLDAHATLGVSTILGY
jgi:hypothetical protein